MESSIIGNSITSQKTHIHSTHSHDCVSFGVSRYAVCLSPFSASFWTLVVTLKFDACDLEDATAASPSRYHTGPRNSLSSVSSLDVDLGEPEDLAIIPEVDPAIEKAHAMSSTPSPTEIFAVPKTKHCNSIIRWV